MGHRRAKTKGTRRGVLTAGLLSLVTAGAVLSAPAGHASAPAALRPPGGDAVAAPAAGAAREARGPGPEGDRDTGAQAPAAGTGGPGAAAGTAAPAAAAGTDTGTGPGTGAGLERADAAPGTGAGDAPGDTGTGTGTDTGTALGAYLDYGPRGIHRMAGLRKWLGGTDLRVGHTYLPGDVWTNIEGRPGFLEHWARWRQDRKDRLFVLNVPMLERNESHLPDPVVRQLLRLGADGRFDRHFRALAERLVGLGAPDTVIVLGWEMNGITYSHRCGPDPEAWKAYWKRIVTAMRAVPGQRFRFDFAPNRGQDAIPWTACYPGDDVVDIIGMDSYDQPPGESFDEQVNQPYGLRHHVEFAAAHGKPISYPEWGLFRNGDNPEYVRGMLKWIERHKPLYHTITDYCPHGVWQCDENPKSSEVFRTMLSGRGGPTQPQPEQPEEPEEPGDPELPEEPEEPQEPELPDEPDDPEEEPEEPGQAGRPDQAGCTPLDLGDWVERWLGRKLCVRFEWRRHLGS
ncbi:glycoside hydrolase family 26 protein [Streptomyces sp. NPDC057116]|uniref:glycoside hydrolase family 26 protein n=1 Tax=Streptomyces sp. NPDC057116 TaxID=3346023 RepID=UPI00363203C7